MTPSEVTRVSPLRYRARELCLEHLPLGRLARRVGTPAYVYSRAAISDQLGALQAAFAPVPHLVCYSVKACSNLSILELLSQGGAGFDIVSGGELARVTRAGGDPSKIVFAGVGKTADEMAAALSAGILLFNVESEEELTALDRVGRRLGRRAPFAIRVNPDVDARTHRHISTGGAEAKFGVPVLEAARLYRASRRMRGVVARGVDCHIGSQLLQLAPLTQALRKLAELYRALLGIGLQLDYLDVGGGLGIAYHDERPPSLGAYARAVVQPLLPLGATLILEPGRLLVGNAGLLLTTVLYRKRMPGRQLVVVDAGMNDLIRPALYDAHHGVVPIRRRPGPHIEIELVGPVCESTDVLARGRKMPLPAAGDTLAILSAGAYGMSMASNYNSRPRPPEVLVGGRAYRVIRRRETLSDLWRGELG